MRAAVFAALLCVAVWPVSANAQMRGGSAHFASGGFHAGATAPASGRVVGTGRIPFTGTPVVRPSFGGRVFLGTTLGFGVPTRRSFPTRNFNPNNEFSFENPFIIGRDQLHEFNRFFRPSGNFWGFGWGGWPYAVDYSDWYADQAQGQYEAEVAQNERLREEMQEDQRRQMQLDQQLADQRAADAASRTVQRAPSNTASSIPTERELPPTVLVYRDHHQVEVRSYAIAGNTIYEIAPHWTRKIQISELDIPATIAANQERGIDFKLPKSSANLKQ
jgi:hypothetical protein